MVIGGGPVGGGAGGGGGVGVAVAVGVSLGRGVGGGETTAAAAALDVCCRSSDQPPPRKAARLTRTSATDATSLVDGRLPRRGSPSIRGRLSQKVQLRCRPAPRVTSDERWQLLDEQAAPRRPRRATYRRRRWLLCSPAVQLSNELPRGNYPIGCVDNGRDLIPVHLVLVGAGRGSGRARQMSASLVRGSPRMAGSLRSGAILLGRWEDGDRGRTGEADRPRR